jgi:hypothetical protein
MGLFDKLKRLERKARGDLDWLDLQDGTRFYFEPVAASKERFMEYLDAMKSIPGPDMSEEADPTAEPEQAPEPELSPIRQALAKATPASIKRFEERYGLAERDCAVIHNDGTVTVAHISLDGSRNLETLDGEEAEEYKERAR